MNQVEWIDSYTKMTIPEKERHYDQISIISQCLVPSRALKESAPFPVFSIRYL